MTEDKGYICFFSDVEQYFYLQKCVIGLIFAIVKNIGQASFLCYTKFCRQVEKVPCWNKNFIKLFDSLKDSQVFRDRIENSAIESSGLAEKGINGQLEVSTEKEYHSLNGLLCRMVSGRVYPIVTLL